MSMISIQLGQCGNQVGTELFDLLMRDATVGPKYSNQLSSENKDYQQQVLERFFTEEEDSTREKSPLVAKSILVDTEPKVINQCIDQANSSGINITVLLLLA